MNYRQQEHSPDICTKPFITPTSLITIDCLFLICLHRNRGYLHLNLLEECCIFSCRISAQLRVYHVFSVVDYISVYRTKEACGRLRLFYHRHDHRLSHLHHPPPPLIPLTIDHPLCYLAFYLPSHLIPPFFAPIPRFFKSSFQSLQLAPYLDCL